MTSVTSIMVPRRGMSVDEVTFIEWTVCDGQTVEEGDAICLIETDKVEMELEAPATGTLRHMALPNSTYAPGAILGEVITGDGH